jgi:multidrug efflux system membrane fusion protein
MLRTLIQRPWLIAIVLSLLLALWLTSGDWLRSREQVDADLPMASTALSQVQIQWLDAQSMQRQQVVQGQVEAWRRVVLRAQISASVVKLNQDKGSRVAAGETLLSLSADSRPAEVARDEAKVRQHEAAFKAAQRLSKSKMLSSNELLKVQSELAKARAELDSSRLALSHTRITAPFAGVYDERQVELGDYLQTGQNLLTLVEIERLKVTAQIAQQDVAQLQLGQRVRVQLIDGSQLKGVLHFIAAAAEPGTRSFRVEVRIDNPQHLRLAGASATLHIQTGETLAHSISPALLSLDSNGRPGVKWLDEQQIVQFSPVELISVGNQQAWVSGLPPRVALITLGQGFVRAGEKVAAQTAGEAN